MLIAEQTLNVKFGCDGSQPVWLHLQLSARANKINSVNLLTY
jgi:hypothetical protein